MEQNHIQRNNAYSPGISKCQQEFIQTNMNIEGSEKIQIDFHI